MNLIIDIGNTHVKLSIFSDNELVETIRIADEDIDYQIKILSKKFELKHSIVSQVGKKIDFLPDILTRQKIKFLFLTSNLRLPFNIKYRTPETLGADRLALVAGALLKEPNTNKLIIDAGTCITYDFIDKNNHYFGGAISPGLHLRYQSLHNYTANLPKLKVPDIKIPLIGTDTESAIHSGVLNGTINEIESFIVKHRSIYKDLTVFLTGGDEKVFVKYIKSKIFVDSKFILPEGMNYILNLNMQL